MKDKQLKVFSTFTGIGGFEMGIMQAWLNVEPEAPYPIIVGYSEIDKYAISVYEKNFEGVKNYGDITKIDTDDLPEFDCLVGGFPCQAFSIAGQRGGFADTRGTLFFELARMLRAKRPRLFVFENVKGLLNHDGGRTFKTILAAIDELGYDAQWQVLNSKNFGVPQNRERVIIVGHIRGSGRPQVFPITQNSSADIVLPTLTARYAPAQANGGYIGHESSQVGTYRTHKDGRGFRATKSGLAPTIPARARQDGSSQPVIVQRARGNNKGQVLETAPTMTGHSYQDNNHLSDGMLVRRLTPVECERLQAFPDNWTKLGKGNVEISDTQRYKMLGNAVTTNVIAAVFEPIFYSMIEYKHEDAAQPR